MQVFWGGEARTQQDLAREECTCCTVTVIAGLLHSTCTRESSTNLSLVGYGTTTFFQVSTWCLHHFLVVVAPRHAFLVLFDGKAWVHHHHDVSTILAYTDTMKLTLLSLATLLSTASAFGTTVRQLLG
jgi:hypothetical protein